MSGLLLHQLRTAQPFPLGTRSTTTFSTWGIAGELQETLISGYYTDMDLVGEFMQLEPDEQNERRASWREACPGAN